jgi:hypothetical protein
MAFDYENSPDVDAIPVADAIRAHYRLPELSPEQQQQRRLDHEIFRQEQAWRDEQRRLEHQQRQDEADAIARHEQALALAEANRRARLERAAEIERQAREIELRDLRMKVIQQSMWQQNVDQAAYNAAQQRYRNGLIGELDAMINPPALPPEPDPVIDQPDDDIGSPNVADGNYNPLYHFHKVIFRR